MKTSRLCRRLAALGLIMLIALPAWSFSWPFGFNPEKEAAALAQRFEEGDDLKPLLEDYLEFEDRLEEETASVRAKYEKKLASIEKEGERFSVDFVVQNDGECQLKDLKWSFKAGSDDVTLTRQQQGSKNSIGKGSQMRGSNEGISSGGLKPSKASDVRFTLSADHVAGSTSTVIVTFTDGISEWEFPMSARF